MEILKRLFFSFSSETAEEDDTFPISIRRAVEISFETLRFSLRIRRGFRWYQVEQGRVIGVVSEVEEQEMVVFSMMISMMLLFVVDDALPS